MSFRHELKLISLEKWNDYRFKFFPPEDFIAVTMLVIRARVFLKVDTSRSEEIFESIENFFVAFNEFYVEFWLYNDSPSNSFLHVRISHVDSKASFTIHEPDNIFGIEFLY